MTVDKMFWSSIFLMFTGIGLGYYFAAIQITYGANPNHVRKIGAVFIWILFIVNIAFNTFVH